jgi:hypothetical protein
VLANKEQVLQVAWRKETGNEAFIAMARVQEIDVVAISHKGEGSEALSLLDLRNVKFGLCLSEAWIDAGFLGFNNGDDVSIGAVKRVIADASRQFDVIDLI